MRVKIIGVIAAWLFIFAAVLPAEVYQYAGKNFGVIGGAYLTTDSVTATFTFADPLEAGTTSVPTPASWTLSDGVNTSKTATTSIALRSQPTPVGTL